MILHLETTKRKILFFLLTIVWHTLSFQTNYTEAFKYIDYSYGICNTYLLTSIRQHFGNLFFFLIFKFVSTRKGFVSLQLKIYGEISNIE